MKKLLPLFFAAFALTLFSCEKEYSSENNGNNGNDQIVGIDCRINKIVCTDTSSKKGIGSIAANINNVDVVTKVTLFNSLAFTIDYISSPVYANDTVYINADEFFVVDNTTKRVKRLHGLSDPTDPFSPQFDMDYFYNASGYLVTKFYSFPVSPVPLFTSSAIPMQAQSLRIWQRRR